MYFDSINIAFFSVFGFLLLLIWFANTFVLKGPFRI